MGGLVDLWWDALDLELRIFYFIGILALFSLAIQTLLSLFTGMDDGLDISGPGEHSSGLSIFSVRGITAFFLGFGWTGVIALKAGAPLPLAIALGIGAGALLMFAILTLMASFLRLQSSGNLNYANAIGQIATVYVTIQPHLAPGGQVEALIQGRAVTTAALHRGDQAIPPGTKVRVTEQVGSSTLIVELTS
jgi:membrane protein implicated in regulation of membrane protease activity